MATARPCKIVDVFGEHPLAGNPVAVVFDAEGLSTEEMLAFTRWTNLSEATFVLPPTHRAADYRVRIFAPGRELPFAGHPTLGTCHAWLEAGGRLRPDGTVVQECAAGNVELRRRSGLLAFEAPPLLRDEAVTDAELDRFAGVLGIDPGEVVAARWADNGPGWAVLVLGSAERVLALEPRADGGRLDVGVVGPHEMGGDVAFEVRAFFTDGAGALREDPVTGSLNAAIAQWFFASGRAEHSFVAAQGARLGCRGRVHLSAEGATVWVGGATHTVVDGVVEL